MSEISSACFEPSSQRVECGPRHGRSTVETRCPGWELPWLWSRAGTRPAGLVSHGFQGKWE